MRRRREGVKTHPLADGLTSYAQQGGQYGLVASDVQVVAGLSARPSEALAEGALFHTGMLPTTWKDFTYQSSQVFLLSGLTTVRDTYKLRIMNDVTENPITVAIAKAGGVRQLAKKLGVTHPAILRYRDLWDAGNQNAIPPARALQIEAATGIPRATLRPDLWSEPARAA